MSDNGANSLSLSSAPQIYPVSVRRLCEFVLRTGDLSAGEGAPRKLRARLGSTVHRKLQKSRPDNYESEVPVLFDVPHEKFVLRIRGRIDGYWNRSEGLLLEEIKTVKTTWDHQPRSLHWAQLKVYGYIWCEQQQLPEIELQLTYCEPKSEQITIFREKLTAAQLAAFVCPVITEYQEWIAVIEDWRQTRNVQLAKLAFPYGEFRKGQRTLSAAVYKTVIRAGKLFAEAPTGIGKTMSVIFSAAKAMVAAKTQRIFYLTAKTVTQSLAEKAFADLKAAGAGLRTVTITAKDKVCVGDGKPCNLADCPFAVGYYDRLKPALTEALQTGILTRPDVESIAAKHRLCPHELSLDISEWVDAVICDYNHAFDPRASLKRHFAEDSDGQVLLIDEAHNLLDRAREMFSALLDLQRLSEARKQMAESFPKCGNALKRFEKTIRDTVADSTLPIARNEIPDKLLKPLEAFEIAAEEYMGELEGSVDQTLLETYFTISAFLQISEWFDVRYRLVVENAFGATRVQLLCLDPSALLAERFSRVSGAILFSATVTPLPFFQAALGGDKEDRRLKLNSPFPPENLKMLVAPYIQTSFRHRNSSVDYVCAAMTAFVRAKKGNYLIYFPSYKYLEEVAGQLKPMLSDCEVLAQRKDMLDAERGNFLHAFQTDRSQTLIGLAVMGGVFGEGIDLVGERLIGAVIVGVGLPQLCLERDLIRNHFDEQGLDGFAYAYLYPGMNRVMQAVGRVIRSESDRGAVLLIDSRFAEVRYRDLFPEWWNPEVCRNTNDIEQASTKFWSAT